MHNSKIDHKLIDELLVGAGFERNYSQYFNMTNFFSYTKSFTILNVKANFFLNLAYDTSELFLQMYGLKYEMIIDNLDLLEENGISKVLSKILEESEKSRIEKYKEFISEFEKLN